MTSYGLRCFCAVFCFALGSILFYGGHLVGMQGKKGRMFRIVMGLLIYAGSVAGGENGIAKYYLLLTEWFYLRFFCV